MADRAIKVLLVEDEPGIRRAMQRELTDLGFDHLSAPSAEVARELVGSEEIDVILLDINLPGMDGIAFFRTFKDLTDPPQVIILSGETSFEKAVEALRLGAYDYQTKPPDPDRLNLVIRKAAERRQLMRDLQRLRQLLAHREQVVKPIGESAAIKRVLTLAHMTVASDTPVLLLGETGSGKEVLAQYVHHISARSQHPFVPINCAAIPDHLLESELFGHERGAFTGAQQRKSGYFEVAEGGTLFLDEIGDMDMGMQAKLLRAVETGTFTRVGGTKPLRSNVRIISATNRDLKTEAEAGRFRADLYYRLQGFDIHIPPLRERREDIPLLVRHFLSLRDGKKQEVTDAAMAALARHSWPGNVRELTHVVEKARILAQGGRIDVEHLPLEMGGGGPQAAQATATAALPGILSPGERVPLEVLEKRYILQVLEEQGGHQGLTAKILDISPRTLYRKLKEWEEGPGSA